jgi:hypothetical protein
VQITNLLQDGVPMDEILEGLSLSPQQKDALRASIINFSPAGNTRGVTKDKQGEKSADTSKNTGSSILPGKDSMVLDSSRDGLPPNI